MVSSIIKGLGAERNLLLTRVCIIGIIINDTHSNGMNIPEVLVEGYKVYAVSIGELLGLDGSAILVTSQLKWFRVG